MTLQRSDLLEACVADGYCPNIKTELFERGIRYPGCTTIFPSITPAGHTAIYTGAYPYRTGITGFRWYQKNNKPIEFEGRKQDGHYTKSGVEI